MRFVSDPPIAVKIEKMKGRNRWLDPIVKNRNIDQTRLIIDDGREDREKFSFLVIGDTGTGQRRYNPQRQVAEAMLPHLEDCRFVLHTGDVVYLVGSSEYYPDNFIKPYKEMLVGGDRPDDIAYDRMTFKTPIFTVPGNHDYYDLPLIEGILAGISIPFRRLLRSRWDFDVGWHGSYQGEAYARAFIDYLADLEGSALLQHLEKYYTAKTDTGYCLNYRPGIFTRLPNRFYKFNYGGIDFFALDSNTFNAPEPIPKTAEGRIKEGELEKRLDELEKEKARLMGTINQPNKTEVEEIDDLKSKLEQIEEIILDIQKQLEATGETTLDIEQLEWLEKGLLESWNDRTVRARILFFHHPPYVTEATKWNLGQTLVVRQHLRDVFDRVEAGLGERGNRPIVDLVLTGHAHCLEHLQTLDTGRGDRNINWLVCGGSGYSLRRQRPEGGELEENERTIARSHLYIGRTGQGSKKRRPYSFLRVDVTGGDRPLFALRPVVVERRDKRWLQEELPTIKM